jgi:hypothetical protein
VAEPLSDVDLEEAARTVAGGKLHLDRYSGYAAACVELAEKLLAEVHRLRAPRAARNRRARPA